MRNRMRIGLAILLSVAVVVVALLILPVVAGAKSASTGTDTGGGFKSENTNALAYDSGFDLLYAGTSHGVWKYNGTTWVSTAGGVSTDRILSLVYDSTHNLLYAGTWGDGVWKYDGLSWTNTGGKVSTYPIYTLVYDSTHNVLYAGAGSEFFDNTSHGVWKYDGTSWTGIGGSTSTYPIYSLAYDSAHSLLYVGCYDKAIKTADNGLWKYDGANWTNTGLSGDSSLTYDSGLVYVGTYGGGVHKSDGTTWTELTGGDTYYFQNIDCLAYDSTHSLLYAGCGSEPHNLGHGVWKYDGAIWTNTYNTTGALPVSYALAYDSTHNLLYAGTGGGVWKYDGANWIDTGGDVSTFYFAEGTCRPNFDTYFCIQNPGNLISAAVTLTYMKGDGTTATDKVSVPPNSRATVNPRSTLGTGDDAAHDFSTKVECTNLQTILVERPMYFNYKGVWTGGHDVMGAVSLNHDFFFAEGTTRPGFEPYICIQNPGSTDAQVFVTYMKGTGRLDSDSLTVKANSRSTVNIKDKLGTGDDPAHDFSIQVFSVQPIVAERPMYFDYHGVWTGGSVVVGETSPSSTYYFAEGTCRPNFDPYFCIQNPGDMPANVKLTYLKGDGTKASDQVTIAPSSRSTISPRGRLGMGNDLAHDFSTTVASDQPIIAERPTYFDYRGWTGGNDVLGATSQYSTACFAEGTTRPGFDPYITIENPGNNYTNANITYMLGNGSTKGQDIEVAAYSRVTVHPADVLGVGDDTAHDFSVKIVTDDEVPIVAERPMYFNYKGICTGGSDVVGYMLYPY